MTEPTDGEKAKQVEAAVNKKKNTLRKVPVLPALNDALGIYDANLPDIPFVIDGLLTRGLTLLLGKPKTGKSWLTLSIAISVATGEAFLAKWNIRTAGAVLYLALEEPPRRTRSRLRKLSGRDVRLQNIRFAYTLLPLMGGGSDQLDQLCSMLHPQLVIVDTLSAVVGGDSRGSGDVFRKQYGEVTCLRELSERHNTAIILVHHARKGSHASDGVDAAAGTGGLTGAGDAIWNLERKQDGEALLVTIGRDAEDVTALLKFNGDSCDKTFGWELQDTGESATLSDERREILSYLRAEGPASLKQVMNAIRRSYEATRKALYRMIQDGVVIRQERDKYIAATKAPLI